MKPNQTPSQNRDKYQIIKNILECLPGQKTTIMYRAEINHYQTTEFLKEMLEAKLITPQSEKINYKNGNTEDRNIYHITEKGKRFLDLADQLQLFTTLEDEEITYFLHVREPE